MSERRDSIIVVLVVVAACAAAAWGIYSASMGSDEEFDCGRMAVPCNGFKEGR
jgi:flagellar basal body-associated protein FliL